MAEKRSHEIAFGDNETEYDTETLIQIFNRKNCKVRKIFNDEESSNLNFNSLNDKEIAERNRLLEEKQKRDLEEMKVLTVLKLMKQKQRRQMEVEALEKQKRLDAICKESKDRIAAAEGLVMLSKSFVKFDAYESDEIIEEKLDDEPNSAEYEFKEVYQQPEGPQRKYRLTEKKIKAIKVIRCST